ncbi:MAG: purine-cytosine permease family protein [Verrucomicrobiia bacterium]|jgi:purine-cytosine permease-like protein
MESQKKLVEPTVVEYEREPVPEQARLGIKSFLGQYAGEHIAGTELMIGPLFVVHGVSAKDVIFGLLVGNLLAVLSWTFMTAPIATRIRLTLYYYLEKICGRSLVTIYDIANGAMFTLLAGAMIAVSTTALGVWLNLPMPGLYDIYPNSIGWVLGVAVVGALFSIIAAYGYKSLARFANIAAPWMILIFLAFGIIGLRLLGMKSFGDFWQFAQTVVWKGGDPLPGQSKFTFWHVMFFAWFCNMAWHIGMADLSVFRYAKKWWYGLASASGMYIGHFMAWLSAGILYAYQLKQDPSNIDVLPGPLAERVCGIAGLLCVIIAGWTTANPTLYRAGLAFQAIFPKSSRFKVTLLTGAIATVAGMFPGIVMRLLDFVALWGMILMPMGAVIFIDFWIFPKIGLRGCFAESAGVRFNPAPAIAWGVTVIVSSVFVLTGKIEIFFVSLPGWFLTGLLYTFASYVVQRNANKLTAAKVL